MFLIGGGVLPSPRDLLSDRLGVLLALVMGIFSLFVGLAVGLPLARSCRALRLVLLRHRLASLSPADRSEVLRPLLTDPLDDTREIAAPLFREFGSGYEISPAAARESRGDEVAV